MRQVGKHEHVAQWQRLQLGVQAVAISPTRELATQIRDECEQLLSTPLPAHPTCGEPREKLQEALNSWRARSREAGEFVRHKLPNFFLHEEGVFDFSKPISCFVRSIGGVAGVDDFDRRMPAEEGKHHCLR